MDVQSWRDHLVGVVFSFQHITSDEVPNVMQGLASKDSVAQVIAEFGEEDAKHILRVDDAIYSALVDYVKPRWPELF